MCSSCDTPCDAAHHDLSDHHILMTLKDGLEKWRQQHRTKCHLIYCAIVPSMADVHMSFVGVQMQTVMVVVVVVVA